MKMVFCLLVLCMMGCNNDRQVIKIEAVVKPSRTETNFWYLHIKTDRQIMIIESGREIPINPGSGVIVPLRNEPPFMPTIKE